MARDLFDHSPCFRDLMALGSDLTGEDLATLCLRGPERRLRQSLYLQPTLVAVSLGYLDCLAAAGIGSDVVLGHSLGEITALAAAGVVTYREAITIAVQRGRLMDEAASQCEGGMLAVLAVPLDTVQALLQEIGQPERLTLANDNAPDQVVVSGEASLLRQFSELVAARHLGRCRALAVAGPWHSPLLASARRQFEHWIAAVAFHAPRVPLVLNATGRLESDPDRIRQSISAQLTAPVDWRGCMRTVRELGVDLVFEVGPGRILSGLARANGLGGATRLFNINNLRGLAHYREEARQPGKQ